MMYQYALAANSEKNATRKRERLMDGPASQLAKFLYDIQAEPGMCALRAIQVASETMSDQPDRAKIIRSAVAFVDQLNSQKMNMLSQKRKEEVPAYEHAKTNKKDDIEKLIAVIAVHEKKQKAQEVAASVTVKGLCSRENLKKAKACIRRETWF